MAGRPKPHAGRPHVRNGEQKRARIANEAARIMAEEGVRDFQMAKRKAVARLDLDEPRHLPTNEEIDAALTAHLQLFQGATSARNTLRLRRIALEAMDFLASFQPRLVGSVLTGTVTPTSEIQLHVSADTPEQVGLFLSEHRIPFRLGDRRVRFGGERYKTVPTYSFVADDVTVELSVFDPRSAREAPLSVVDGRPIRRGNIKDVEALITR